MLIEFFQQSISYSAPTIPVCIRDIPTEVDTAATTCPSQLIVQQPSLPECTATETDVLVSTTAITETLISTMTVASVLIRSHYITVTATHTIPEVSLLPCTQIHLLNSSSVQDAALPPSTPSPGLVAAIVLGIVLVILVMACAVAWVVCFRRKKRKLKADRSGRLHEHA